MDSFQISWQKTLFITNFCRWLDSNRGPLEPEATTLPTAPQPLPFFYLPYRLLGTLPKASEIRDCVAAGTFKSCQRYYYTKSLNVINKSWNKALWLAVESHMTSFNQSDCSLATLGNLKFVNDIKLNSIIGYFHWAFVHCWLLIAH